MARKGSKRMVAARSIFDKFRYCAFVYLKNRTFWLRAGMAVFVKKLPKSATAPAFKIVFFWQRRLNLK